MPTDQFSDLAYAPFKWSVIKKPEVWGGLLTALGTAAAVGYLWQLDGYLTKPSAASRLGNKLGNRLTPLYAFPVGISEEALFRGYLQSHLSESLTPTGGIIASSLLFGAAHISNGLLMEDPEDQRRYFSYSIPFITAFGAYFGWLAHHTNSLQEGVALHSWYDFALFSLDAATKGAISTGTPSFAFSLPF
jgi:membrane protease YdiL (CAAX protease family)